MWRRFKRKCEGIAIIPRLVVAAILGWVLPVICLDGVFAFTWVVHTWILVAVCLFLILCARTTAGHALCILLTMVSTLYAGAQTQRMVIAQPMTSIIEGGEYVDAPLPEVLFSITRQKHAWPKWICNIADRRLAETNITVKLPKRCTLREGLDAICAAAGADYQCGWFKGCGNEPEPTFSMIYLKPKTTPKFESGAAMQIYGHGIYWSREWRTNSTLVVLTNLPPTTFRADR